MINEKISILIGSCIYQKKNILKEFLISLKELNKELFNVEYIFIDDNIEMDSSEELLQFNDEERKIYLYDGYREKEKYICDEYSHYWNDNIIEKVTNYKNFIINRAIEGDYDYLFLIDSDIVLHPKTLNRLVLVNKDIVSNIFWTKWHPDKEEMPQVWVEDSYSFCKTYGREAIDNVTREREKLEFFDMLNTPGTYKVGGLGACTLIKRKVLESGVDFSRLYNLSFWGEDRHFCIRATANNFELYVDTFYPAYHIYREENLKGLNKYKDDNLNRDIEIMGKQIFALIRVGVNRLNTYDYNGWKDDYKAFFTEDCIKNILDVYDKKIYRATKERIINTCEVLTCNMNFNNNLDIFKGTIEYIEKGYRGEYSFYNESIAELEVIKINNGIWRINSFKKVRDKELEFEPLKRRVREKNKLTLSMIVKNEEKRYLKEVLDDVKQYIDEAVIIDDGSTDNTVGVIEKCLEGVKTKIIRNDQSKFSNEWILRRQQWDETIKTDPEWILFLDADEIFEKKFKYKIKDLIKDKDIDVYRFRIYDMWNSEYYRADNLWYIHKTYRPFLIRYQQNFEYEFLERNQHCGRMPVNINQLQWCNSQFRIKHLGWSKEEDRINKYNRYMLLDGNGKYGNINQYKSIFDKNPILEKWIE